MKRKSTIRKSLNVRADGRKPDSLHCRVRRLKAEIRELKSELRSETRWANEYFKTCEQLNKQLNKYREKDQSLLRTMVVQSTTPRKP